MVSTTYLVALVALLGSAVTSAHAHRNAAAEIRGRLDRRALAKGSLNGPAAGCYTYPESFKEPTGNIDVSGVQQPASHSIFMTASLCARACVTMKKEVIAVSGTECLCGSLFPKKSSQVDDTKCDQKCTGYGDVMCKYTSRPCRTILTSYRRISRRPLVVLAVRIEIQCR